jgi:hypothetical protein
LWSISNCEADEFVKPIKVSSTKQIIVKRKYCVGCERVELFQRNINKSYVNLISFGKRIWAQNRFKSWSESGSLFDYAKLISNIFKAIDAFPVSSFNQHDCVDTTLNSFEATKTSDPIENSFWTKNQRVQCFLNISVFFFFLDTVAMGFSLNWLLHKMFMIRDFEFCKKLIEQQMKENLNQEYLFYVKVRTQLFSRLWVICFQTDLSVHFSGSDLTWRGTLSRST